MTHPSDDEIDAVIMPLKNELDKGLIEACNTLKIPVFTYVPDTGNALRIALSRAGYRIVREDEIAELHKTIAAAQGQADENYKRWHIEKEQNDHIAAAARSQIAAAREAGLREAAKMLSEIARSTDEKIATSTGESRGNRDTSFFARKFAAAILARIERKTEK